MTFVANEDQLRRQRDSAGEALRRVSDTLGDVRCVLAECLAYITQTEDPEEFRDKLIARITNAL